MIMHLYQPGICPHCQAQYWVASLTHDKPSWQKAEQDAGRDAQNINECPVSVMISRIEPTIVMPPGARH